MSARAKKGHRLEPSQPLPIAGTQSEQNCTFKGIFNGFSVAVTADMEKILSMGCFGKANFSRSYPQFHQQKIIRNRIFQRRQQWSAKGKHKPEKTVVIPDSDSDDNEYFINLKPEYQLDYSGISEAVHLSLEEAFFLVSALNCLELSFKDTLLGINDAWVLFSENDKYFIPNYISYYYFRSRNWIVKPGIKFGGDFLLYQGGPAFYHASYLVIVNIVDETFNSKDHLNRRSMSYMNLKGLNRLCETAGKELLICEVIWPVSLPENEVSWGDISKFSIKTTLMKRWILSKEREANNSCKTF